MKGILYCRDISSNKSKSLFFPHKTTTKLQDVYASDCPLVIFDEKFIKKSKKLDNSRLKSKVCFVHFTQEHKDNLKIVKQLGFFDYFSDQDSKSFVSFKFLRAEKLIKLNRKVYSLEKQVNKKDAEIENITLIDPITGCYNWRYLSNRITQEINRARRHFYSISFIAVDIDHFTRINELYGVKVADTIIKEFVGILGKALRTEDILARWREDEFFIIAPHLEAKDSYMVAKRIGEKISTHKFKYHKVAICLKASLGVTTSPEDHIFSVRDIVNTLNGCLASAKRKGGNTIVLYSQADTTLAPEKHKKANTSELQGKIDKMNKVMNRDLLDTIYGFARTIEAKDSYTGKHVEYTAGLAEEVAKALRLSTKEVEDVRHAAVLHDLGKIAIDKSILSKAGSLSPEERESIRTHPAIAAEILREIHGLRGAIPAILYHHERYDGKGYPLGLKGDDIPLNARIVAVADVYQALISDRPYRKAYVKKKALEIIKSEAGKQFDPKIVRMFLRIIKRIDAQER